MGTERRLITGISYLYILIITIFSALQRLQSCFLQGSFSDSLLYFCGVSSVWILLSAAVVIMLRIMVRKQGLNVKTLTQNATIRKTVGLLLIINVITGMSRTIPFLISSVVSTVASIGQNGGMNDADLFVRVIFADVFILFIEGCLFAFGYRLMSVKDEHHETNYVVVYGVSIFILMIDSISLLIGRVLSLVTAGFEMTERITSFAAMNSLWIVVTAALLFVLIKKLSTYSGVFGAFFDAGTRKTAGILMIIQGLSYFAAKVSIIAFLSDADRAYAEMAGKSGFFAFYPGNVVTVILTILQIILGVIMLLYIKEADNQLLLYQISKYDPNNRDQAGGYQLDEWTSVTDIGKEYNSCVFDLNTYVSVEGSYIAVLDVLMKHFDIEFMYISILEKDKVLEYSGKIEKYPELYSESIVAVYRLAQEGKRLDKAETLAMCRLLLREDIRCDLRSEGNRLNIIIGYDFYMKIQCGEISSEITDVINNQGLFIETLKYKQWPQRTIHRVSIS